MGKKRRAQLEGAGQWQSEWPTKPGVWWFYGWRFRKSSLANAPEPPELCLVEVHKTSGKYPMTTSKRLIAVKRTNEGRRHENTVPRGM